MRNAGICLVLGLLMLTWSCDSGIPTFSTDQFETNGMTLHPYFQQDHITPVKDQWPELYQYLEKGHIQAEAKSGKIMVYSFDFYKFITNQRSQIYETPFLQQYSQFLTVFGPPTDVFVQEEEGGMIVFYAPTVYGETCPSCESVKKLQYHFDGEGKLIPTE